MPASGMHMSVGALTSLTHAYGSGVYSARYISVSYTHLNKESDNCCQNTEKGNVFFIICIIHHAAVQSAAYGPHTGNHTLSLIHI